MRASVAEKLLVVLLARLANSEPEDRTTRTRPPKQSDAGDILRGKETSIGMAVELRRLIGMCRDVFTASEQSAFLVTQEVKAFIDAMHAILAAHRLDPSVLSDEERRVMTELLNQTVSAYRWSYYHHGLSGQVAELRTQHILALLDLVQRYANVVPNAQQRSGGAIPALAAQS
jgi:hypothetical protein